MGLEDKSIKCPGCSTEINVSDLLYHQVHKEVQHELENDYSKRKAQIEESQKAVREEMESVQRERTQIEQVLAERLEQSLRKEKADMAEMQRAMTEDRLAIERERISLESQITERLKAERLSIEKNVRQTLEQESSAQIETMRKELDTKSQQIIALRNTRAELEQAKREMEELKHTITFEKEKEYSEKLAAERARIHEQAQQNSFLKIAELEKQLNDQKDLVDEMKRKAEQGSMQLQGEVQELAIEDILRTQFPIDTIEEVAKGVRGADACHIVRNRLGVECGKILYESKRTKVFNDEWIGKLKADAVAAKADVCVIVTEALPEGIEKIGQKDGVWICSFFDFKGLVLILRQSIIDLHAAYSSQMNKGEKMEMLYAYLTSTEFKLQIESIVQGFAELESGYQQEKRAMERIWKQREKQLQRVLLNTNHFIGSIKGIAGASIGTIDATGELDPTNRLLSQSDVDLN